MGVKVQCPNPACGKAGNVPEAALGRSVRCPHCGQRFPLAAPLDPAAATAAPPAARATLVPGPPATATTSGDGPTAIGRFQVRARLGAGAFGTVYRAYDPQLDREVALKVPQPGTLDGPKRVERFLREAKAAAQLRHPYIVPVHEAGRDGDTYYIAAAFIRGQTLNEACADGPLEPKRAAQVVRQLAEALAYAHDLGIVHRDIKPANVMVDAQGQPLVMDFGLAARRDEAEKITHDGAVLGTPAYMAPEQAAGQKGNAIPASDQYSLGIVLYELLCGQVPFAGPPQIVLYHAVHTEPPSPRSVHSKVPRDLETICLKALAKKPGERYPSCRELADDLRRWLDGDPIRARRLGVGERLVRWARRHPARAGLVAAGAVLAGAAVLLSVTSRGREEAERGRVEAEAAARRSQEAGDLEYRRRYFADIALAQRSTQASDGAAALRLLAPHLGEGERSRDHGWELPFLLGQVYRPLELRGANTEHRPNAAPCWSGDGRFLALEERVNSADQVTVWDIFTGRSQTLAGTTMPTWSPRGAILATVRQREKQVTLWNAQGERLRDLDLGDTPVWELKWSDDGRRLAAASRVSTVNRVLAWEAADGREMLHLEGHHFPVAWSPDGSRLAVGSSARQANGSTYAVHICPVSGGTPGPGWPHGDLIPSATWSPDGTRLATTGRAPGDGGGRATLFVWDVAGGRAVSSAQLPTDRVPWVAWSANGTRLFALAREVQLIDPATGRIVQALAPADSITIAGLDGAGRLRVLGPSGVARLYELSAGLEVGHFTEPKGTVSLGAWHPRSGLCAVVDFNRAVQVRLTAPPSLGGATKLVSCGDPQVSPNGRLVAGTAAGGALALWDPATGREVRKLAGGTGPCRWSPDGRLLAGVRDGKLQLWNTADGSPRTTGGDVATDNYVWSRLEWSPTGAYLAYSCKSPMSGQNLRLFDANAGSDLPALTATGPFAWSPDGSRLVSLSTDGISKLMLWTAGTGAVVVGKAGGPRVQALTWSRYGKQLAVALVASEAYGKGRDEQPLYRDKGTVEIWDAETGTLVRPLVSDDPAPTGAFPTHLTWHADGSRLLSGGYNEPPRLWDPATGKLLHALVGHRGGAPFAAWHPTQPRLATSGGGEVKVWAVEDGGLVLLLNLPLTGTFSGAVAWSPDGRRLIAQDERDVRVWDATVGEELRARAPGP